MKKKISFISKAFCVVFIIWGLLMIYVRKSDKEFVAYYFDDYRFDPIVFQNEIYFTDEAYSYGEGWNIETDAKKYGRITNRNLYEKKGKKKLLPEYIISYLIVNQIWADKNDNSYEHLIIRGGDGNEYSKVSYLENPSRIQKLLEKYSSFILVSKNDTWHKKCLISKELIIELEMQYGECDYILEDFYEMSEAYYIYVNPFLLYQGSNEELKAAGERDRHVSGRYIATIFVDDEGKLYYCNRDNLIDDEMTQKIYAVLEEGDMLEE